MNKLKIRKLGILSVAKIYAAMTLVMSLLISIPFGLLIIVQSLFGAVMFEGSSAVAVGGGGVLIGILIMIGIPIFYTIIGFISGVIGALIYNIFAGIVGGIEIEVENIH